MVLERDNYGRLEHSVYGFVEVHYGEVASTDLGGRIGTDALESCVAVVLFGEEVLSLAHFPLEDPYPVFSYNGHEIISENETHRELADLMFSQHGPVSEDTEAMIIGGVEGLSEPLIEKLQGMLGERGIKDSEVKGPHSEDVLWYVRVKHGGVTIVEERSHQHSFGESSY